MTSEAIILAGGFGTRLRSAVSDVPKPLAPINGVPFLARLLGHLARRGFDSVVLAVGYRHEQILAYLNSHPVGIEVRYSIEENALGTGGAVKLALRQVHGDDVFVLNGDTFKSLDHRAMLEQHRRSSADMTVCLTTVSDRSRYGSVQIDDHCRIVRFVEKSEVAAGFVNAGVYVINRSWALTAWPEGVFSLETDVLLRLHHQSLIMGFLSEGDFLDIGTPESYADATRFVALLDA